MKSYNSFKVAQDQIIQAARLLGLNQSITDLLKWPQKEFSFTLPVKMDDGSTQIFHAYRIQYNYAGSIGKCRRNNRVIF